MGVDSVVVVRSSLCFSLAGRAGLLAVSGRSVPPSPNWMRERNGAKARDYNGGRHASLLASVLYIILSLTPTLRETTNPKQIHEATSEAVSSKE